MKILQLANKVPYPPKDGGSIAIMNLANEFSARGHEVTLLAMLTPKHQLDLSSVPDMFSNKITFSTVRVDTTPAIIPMVVNLLFSRKPYIAQRFISQAFEKKLTEIITSTDFDIIQLEGLYLVPYIPAIRKLSNAKIAFRAHNIEFKIWKRQRDQTKNLIKKAYIHILYSRLKRFEKSIINTYDLLVPITDRDNNIFSKLGNRKPVHIVPAGINIKAWHAKKTDPEYPSVFFIGSLDWIPNQEGLTWFLDHVWMPVKKKHPKWPFYVAGRNAPRWLEKKLLQSKIDYLGEVNDANIFMESKALMVVPLFSGSGMRVKIIEGMAMNKTIVTTGMGAEGIDFKGHNCIAIANSAEEFIITMEKLLDNRSIFQEIGENAGKFVREKYDNKKIVAGLLNFYIQYTTG